MTATTLAPRLETLVLAHTLTYVVFATWAFGGNIGWAQPLLCAWGTAGAALTVTALALRRRSHEPDALRPFRWLLPWLGLNAIILAGLANPSFARVPFFETEVLRPVATISWLPSSARPDLAWRKLWLFDGLFLAGFNLAVAVRRRRTLRTLFLALAGNALVLAVFGTVQKLLRADIYFGLETSPNPAFFATFFYHNHWGAFALMMTALCLGFVFHYARRPEHRDFWHSPAAAGLCATLVLAATLPLSTSRSSTLLAAVLLGGALLHALWLQLPSPRSARRPARSSALLILLGAALGAGAIYGLGREVISQRLAKTQEQLATIRARGDLGDRVTLYRNTWRMARDRLWFGWGFDSYPTVFMLYNTQESTDRLPAYYQEAHSDWLQATAETGLIGATLLVLTGAWPLASRGIRACRSLLGRYLLAGCGLVALYAWIEFPFDNPAVALTWWVLFFGALRYATLPDETYSRHAAPATVPA
ncbi:MAG TPA: O-antigen ligase family protein [Opitutaceae bacterium]